MPIEWTARFERDFDRLSPLLQDRVERVVTLLDERREHPSLHLKRLRRFPGFWELRVTDEHRILLIVKSDLFTLMAIGKHEILERFKRQPV